MTLIADPSFAYLLLILGIYGILLELFNPGYYLPGLLGGLCLLFALYSLQAFPLNYVGLALIVVSFAFYIGEVFIPSGVLAIIGLIAFISGSFLLFSDSNYQLSWHLIALVTLLNTAFLLWLGYMALKARNRPVLIGQEAFKHEIAIVTESFDKEGWVRLNGELWRARTTQAVQKNEKVRIIGRDGLILLITKSEP